MTDTNFPPSAARPVLYRGRRWTAVMLLALAPICMVMAIFTATLEDAWLAILLMGLPLAVSAYLCAVFGWGEAIARIELDDVGVSLTLPRYRGFLPAWPAQRLTATWPEVKEVRQRHVRGRLFVFAFDYIRRRIVTVSGDAVLIEPLQMNYFGDPKGVRQNIPASEIIAEITRRTGLAPQEDGEIWGGGMIRNLLAGGPE